MRMPRATIAGLMALVLLAALDAGAYRSMAVAGSSEVELLELLFFGGLPMANVLAVGLIILMTWRGTDGGGRAALGGFEAFGAAALGFYAAASLAITDPLYDGVGRLVRSIGPSPGPAFLAVAAAVLLLPQLALALLGARLARACRA